jgi:signal transduction histidine kinase
MDVTPNRFGMMFDAVSIALCAVDGDGNILRSNPAMQQLMGWEPSEPDGQPLARYLQEAIVEPAHALWWTVALSQAVAEGKTTYLNQPTRFCTASNHAGLDDITGAMIAIEHGQDREPGAIVAIYGPDVLASTEGVRKRMFSAMAHELGSPLTNIALAAEVLAASEPQDERQRRLIGIIRDEVTRLRRLMAQFVAASPSEKHVTPGRNMVTLRPLLRRVTRVFGLQDEGSRILVDVPPDLPFVWGDADAIQQVLGNLMDKALRRTPAGTPIRLQVKTIPGEVQVCVVYGAQAAAPDQGQPGHLPAGLADNPANGGSRPEDLGLSLSTSLVRSMGGRLWHGKTDPGQSCFCFTLPCAEGTSEEEEGKNGSDNPDR